MQFCWESLREWILAKFLTLVEDYYYLVNVSVKKKYIISYICHIKEQGSNF